MNSPSNFSRVDGCTVMTAATWLASTSSKISTRTCLPAKASWITATSALYCSRSSFDAIMFGAYLLLHLPQKLARAVGALVRQRRQSADGERSDSTQQVTQPIDGTGIKGTVSALRQACHFLEHLVDVGGGTFLKHETWDA